MKKDTQNQPDTTRDTIDTTNIKFGELFSEHMLVSDYLEGEWSDPRIIRSDKIELHPSIAALHYGQSIFEGFKAYRVNENRINIFRPQKKFERFNASARRLAMPEISEDIFISGMKKLVERDQYYIPNNPDSSLYIRPLMFSTDNSLSVRPSNTCKFAVLTCPVGK